jgi:amino acid transporter
LALAGTFVSAFAPLVSETGSSATPGSAGTSDVVRHISVVDDQGISVLVPLAVPVVVAIAGMLGRSRTARVISALLLWAFCVIGLASIGMFFIPAALLMTVAAARRDHDVTRRPPAPASVRPS